MIRSLIGLSSRNRFLVLFVVGFVILWGLYAMQRAPLDAIPDLSDTQVIIYTEWPGRSPDLVEDQVTYPIASTLLAAPKVKAVRGQSFLGSSFIYVIFEDGTDIYWARSRIIEYLQSVKSKIPATANPVLGPDATSLGWGFSYAIVDETGRNDLAELRSMQDFNLKLALESVPGVAQVASIGGFVRQYQVTIDPNKCLAYDTSMSKLIKAIRGGNNEVEGRVIERSGTEYIVRGKAYIKGIEDIENIVVESDNGTPVLVKDLGRVQLGPEIRRGLADLDGRGEVAGGIVVVRFGENVLTVVDRVKEKIAREIAPSLPKGVRIVTTYDRSDLINKAINTVSWEIVKLSIAVAIVCLVFLFHFPSAFVVILTLPVAIIASFICMNALNVTTNIMSLAGIAIAIGAMVDAAIVMVENAHKRLEEWEQSRKRQEPVVRSQESVKNNQNETAQGSDVGAQFVAPSDRATDLASMTRADVIIDAAKEVGPSLFFSLLVITVAFLPVFAYQGQAGRLFTPLAFTKTLAMLFASFLAVTLTPVLMTLFIRGRLRPERDNPVSVFLQKLYAPVAVAALNDPRRTVVVAFVLLAVTLYPVWRMGSEFMPALFEGSLFYMPVTAPSPSVTEVSRLLQLQDRIIKQHPEVAQVFGKAGRAETATDPAPFEMFETVITLKPESQWRPGVTPAMIADELNDALTIPGVSNSFTMPIKARIDMLSTGIRTRLGLKILGSDLAQIEQLGMQIEAKLRKLPGTRSIYAERVNTGYFLDITVNRREAARYGLLPDDVLEIVQAAVGGITLTTTIEGRERYPVNVRYMRELRDDLETIKRILVPLPQRASLQEQEAQGQVLVGSAHVPLAELADIRFVKGPTAIKSEEGLLAAYVYIDYPGEDIGSYIERASKELATLKVPDGYRLKWSGDFEYLQESRKQLWVIVPLTLALVFLLLYLNTRSLTKTAIVLLAVPFSLIGAFWLLWALNFNMSVAVIVGLIALAGIDAETGVVMLLYLDLAYKKWRDEGRLRTKDDLREAVMYGAVKRLRPKIMTVCVILAGLVPILFSSGIGSDVMKRIAAPMVGGIVTSALLELLLYPVIYMAWKEKIMEKGKWKMGNY